MDEFYVRIDLLTIVCFFNVLNRKCKNLEHLLFHASIVWFDLFHVQNRLHQQQIDEISHQYKDVVERIKQFQKHDVHFH